MPRFDAHISRSGRPPPMSRREAHRRHYVARESAHSDASARADVLVAVDDEIDARGLFRADAHRAAGIPPHSLDNGTLTTAQLQAALDVLRGLPTP